ncbi:hypothetical protein ACLOJK_038065 [Asimina triloba]
MAEGFIEMQEGKTSEEAEKIASPYTLRRLSIYSNIETLPCKSFSHLRSFFVFALNGQSMPSPITSFAGLSLLREVHINLYKTEIKHLPSSVGKLIKLETLILEDNCICELPSEICKLQNLRHLSVTRLQINGAAVHINGAKVARGGLRGLTKIQVKKGAMPTLEILSIEHCKALVEEPCWLHHLANLKKLLMKDMPTDFLNFLKSGGEQADCIQHIPLVQMALPIPSKISHTSVHIILTLIHPNMQQQE